MSILNTGKSVKVDGEIIAVNAALLRLFKGEYRDSGDRHSDSLLARDFIAHLQSQLDECRKENKFLVADYRRVQKQKLKVERELCHEIAARKIRQQLAAHVAAATAKERQAREALQSQLDECRKVVAAKDEALKEASFLGFVCDDDGKSLEKNDPIYRAIHEKIEIASRLTPSDLASKVLVERSEWERLKALDKALEDIA
jgi:hypothetical protein